MVVTIIQENLKTINVLQISFTNHSTNYPRQCNLKKGGRKDVKVVIFHPKALPMSWVQTIVSYFFPASDFK